MHEHIVKSFDIELTHLRNQLVQMGRLAQNNLNDAVCSVVTHNASLAQSVIIADQYIDELDRQISAMATRLLALRQPMAFDLRFIIGSLKLATHIERIGDYAKNTGRRTDSITDNIPEEVLDLISNMHGHVFSMMNDALDALSNNKSDTTFQILNRDNEVDLIYKDILRILLAYMEKNTGSIAACTQLLFVARNIERIGDHISNMVAITHAIMTGKSAKISRSSRLIEENII